MSEPAPSDRSPFYWCMSCRFRESVPGGWQCEDCLRISDLLAEEDEDELEESVESYYPTCHTCRERLAPVDFGLTQCTACRMEDSAAGRSGRWNL